MQGSLRRSSVVAQDALWSNEDCYSAFVSHDPVVFVEVVVGAFTPTNAYLPGGVAPEGRISGSDNAVTCGYVVSEGLDSSH